MTNYIPADKLIAGIEKHIKEVKDAASIIVKIDKL